MNVLIVIGIIALIIIMIWAGCAFDIDFFDIFDIFDFFD